MSETWRCLKIKHGDKDLTISWMEKKLLKYLGSAYSLMKNCLNVCKIQKGGCEDEFAKQK